MRPALRRLFSGAITVAFTVGLSVGLAAVSASPAAAATTWKEKDFGTVCSSATGIIQLRVVYEVGTITYSTSEQRTGQWLRQTWIRAYDTQNAQLVVQSVGGGSGTYYGGSFTRGPEYNYPKDPIAATGGWQKVAVDYTDKFIGPYSWMNESSGAWGRGSDWHQLRFWLNSTIAACTVDITSGYSTAYGWAWKDCGNDLVLSDVVRQDMVGTIVANTAPDRGARWFSRDYAKAAIADECTVARSLADKSTELLPAAKTSGAPKNGDACPTYTFNIGSRLRLNGVPFIRLQMAKYFCHDGQIVYNGVDRNVPPPNAETRPFVSDPAKALGVVCQNPAAIANQWEMWNGNPKGKHRSTYSVTCNWQPARLNITLSTVTLTLTGVVFANGDGQQTPL